MNLMVKANISDADIVALSITTGIPLVSERD
jgi:bisphosphoglycerate-dependent phosphoglycerate mutase